MNEELKTEMQDEEMFCEYIDPEELPEDEEYIDEVKPHFYHRKSFWILSAFAGLAALAAAVAVFRALTAKNGKKKH